MKHLIYKNLIYFWLFQFYRKLKQTILRLIPDDLFIKLKYRKTFGQTLNLRSPKNFNEKLQWLKLYDRKDIYTNIADKYKVRAYLSNRLGTEVNKYLVPIIFETKKINNLKPDNLPNSPCIIKSNHDQGGFKILFKKEEQNFKELQLYFKNRLYNNFFWVNREWPYKNIERRIIVEKLILTKKGDLPTDLKLHFFNGDMKYYIISEFDSNGKKKYAYYDYEHNLINDYINDKNRLMGKSTQINYDSFVSMLVIAKKIATEFKFIRVDFLLSDDKFYLGELTFFPGAGFSKHYSEEFLKKAGDWLEL